LLLTPSLHDVWGHYSPGCQQLFNDLATYPGRLRADARAGYDILRKLRGELGALTDAVSAHLAALDKAMQGPSTEARGQEIARLTNALDFANDKALHFALGLSLPGLDRRKQAARRPRTSATTSANSAKETP